MPDTPSMTKKERVRAALHGEAVDRVPVSLWGHDFLREWSPSELVAQTLERYRANDWDFIKLNPRWTFFAEPWGNRYQRPVDQRFPRLLEAVVKSPADLASVEPIDGASGAFGEQLAALRLLLDEVGDEVDVLYTVFSPLSVLGLLCGGVGQPLVGYAGDDPAATHQAIATVAETLIYHAELALDAGASGIFYAPLQWSSRSNCTDDFYREFGRPYDLQLLQAVREAEFNVLHVCGDHDMLPMLADYPVAALNWADHGEGNLSLTEARAMTAAALMGGIDHASLHEASPDEARLEVRDTLALAPSRFILAGGCGISPLTPAPVLEAVVAAARG